MSIAARWNPVPAIADFTRSAPSSLRSVALLMSAEQSISKLKRCCAREPISDCDMRCTRASTSTLSSIVCIDTGAPLRDPVRRIQGPHVMRSPGRSGINESFLTATSFTEMPSRLPRSITTHPPSVERRRKCLRDMVASGRRMSHWEARPTSSSCPGSSQKPSSSGPKTGSNHIR